MSNELPPEALVLLAAIHAALEVPYARSDATKQEKQARRDTLDMRVSDVRATLGSLLAVPLDALTDAAGRLRAYIDDSPIEYPTYPPKENDQ